MSRRLKIVRLSNEMLAALLRLDGTTRVRIEGLPADAKLVGVTDKYLFDRDQTAFKFESAEFPEVPGGEAIPWLDLAVSEGRDDESDEFQVVGAVP